MPPNRKSNVDVVDNHVINVNDLQPKFLPLTHPNEAQQDGSKGQQALQQQQQQQHSQQEASHDAYWNWPSDQDRKQDMIERILEEDRIRKILSATHLEENAVQQMDTSPSQIRTNAVDEDYWQWPSEESDIRGANRDPSHPSQDYWNWPTHSKEEEKKLLIQNILEEDRCHRLLSIDHVEQNLKKHVIPPSSPKSSINVANDEYWTWDSK